MGRISYIQARLDRSDQTLGECLSGQKDQTVNLATYVYAGSNPASPIWPVLETLPRMGLEVDLRGLKRQNGISSCSTARSGLLGAVEPRESSEAPRDDP